MALKPAQKTKLLAAIAADFGGIDGLIKQLADKNRQAAQKAKAS